MGWILKDGERIYDEDEAFQHSLERALCTERGSRIGRPEYGVAHRRFRSARRNDDSLRDLSDQIREMCAGLVAVRSLDFEEDGDDTRVTINGRFQVVLRA